MIGLCQNNHVIEIYAVVLVFRPMLCDVSVLVGQMQFGLCSLRLVRRFFLVWPMYEFPQLHVDL